MIQTMGFFISEYWCWTKRPQKFSYTGNLSSQLCRVRINVGVNSLWFVFCFCFYLFVFHLTLSPKDLCTPAEDLILKSNNQTHLWMNKMSLANGRKVFPIELMDNHQKWGSFLDNFSTDYLVHYVRSVIFHPQRFLTKNESVLPFFLYEWTLLVIEFFVLTIISVPFPFNLLSKPSTFSEENPESKHRLQMWINQPNN